MQEDVYQNLTGLADNGNVPAAMFLNELSRQITPNLAEDERWQTVQRIVDSPHFCKSPRLSRLLLYLSEQTLLDRIDLLTEQTIAIMVFERKADFDPGVDTIVRSHMVRLRQRLDQYAAEFPAVCPVRVTVPKGEYVVRFECTATTFPQPMAADLSSETPTAQGQSPSPSRRTLNPLAWLCGVMGLVIVVLIAALYMNHTTRKLTETPAVTHPLWSYFFQSHQVITFVAADNGLVLLHRMTKKDTTLAEYLARDFSRQLRGLSKERVEEVMNIADRRYTSFVDLNLFRRVQQLPFSSPGGLVVKYARDVQMDELKQGNIILSGARGANPWLELYEPQLNFIGSNDAIRHTYSFLNLHPQTGEPDRFFVSESDPKKRTLGVLAFLPNLGGNGNVLIVEGNSMAGTEAISDFLFNDHALLPFLSKIKRSDGTLPHFEVLIDSNSINGSAGAFHILAYRTHP
jgi:hypothetical protein